MVVHVERILSELEKDLDIQMLVATKQCIRFLSTENTLAANISTKILTFKLSESILSLLNYKLL